MSMKGEADESSRAGRQKEAKNRLARDSGKSVFCAARHRYSTFIAAPVILEKTQELEEHDVW